MTKFLLLISLLTQATSCIKTADQVNRERRFESMTEQLADSQSLVADMVAQMKDIQTQLNQMNGRLEEIENNQQKIKPENFKKMEENSALLKSQQEAQNTQLLAIQAELKEQREFIEKVTKSLNDLSKPAPKAQKKSAKDELSDGLGLVKANKYSEARRDLEALVDHKDLGPADNNKVLHGLGRVEFYTKNYEKALVYFSKIYTNYPRSSLAPSSLLFIARSLDRIGKKKESKEAYNQVIEEYSDNAAAAEAKKEL